MVIPKHARARPGAVVGRSGRLAPPLAPRLHSVLGVTQARRHANATRLQPQPTMVATMHEPCETSQTIRMLRPLLGAPQLQSSGAEAHQAAPQGTTADLLGNSQGLTRARARSQRVARSQSQGTVGCNASGS